MKTWPTRKLYHKTTVSERTRKITALRILIRFRSSCPKMFCKKCALRNFAKFTGKHLCQGLFLIKLQASTLLKKRLWHRCFPVNMVKFSRRPFYRTSPDDCFWRFLKNTPTVKAVRCNLMLEHPVFAIVKGV